MPGLLSRARVVRWTLAKIWSHPGNQGKRAQRLVRFLWASGASRVGRRRTVISFGRRSRIYVTPDFPVTKMAARSALPDFLEMSVWINRLSPGDLFLDVGANVGFYTIVAAECGAEVVSVEPGEDVAGELRRNLALNGLDATVLPCALLDEPGETHLSQQADPAVRHVVLDQRSGVAVAVSTLDEIIGDRRVAGIKIDVEGAEELVLKGGLRALKEQRIDLLQMEWNASSQALLGHDRFPIAELLEQHGYELMRPSTDGEMRLDPSPALGRDVFARPRR